MVFQKGISGNPSGRPKGTGYNDLKAAVDKYRNSKGESWFEAIVSFSLKEPTVAKALIDKLAPNLAVQENISTEYKIVLEKKESIDDGHSDTTDSTKELATADTR